ncbi:hypothetical protein AVEN_69783-1 [Araneus ventricosus]|uniref:Uncharacterized protein n=1 Tax=Araneus ventricosus TaxID=182803 RepID=A0A4Y2CXW6_ARAVE|nr:hypothetical protein AVEN_69783-1 [Araneus ventricosus]
MQYTWFPGMTMCMSMLTNTTMGPSSRMDSAPVTVKNGIPYTRYLQAAMILIRAAMPTALTRSGQSSHICDHSFRALQSIITYM